MYKYTVILAQLAPELALKFIEQKNALDATVQELQKVIQRSEQYKYTAALAETPPIISVNAFGSFEVAWKPRMDPNAVQLPKSVTERPKVLTYLETSTLNALLHSNLLSSSEKRRLAKTLLFDLADDHQPAKDMEAPTKAQS